MLWSEAQIKGEAADEFRPLKLLNIPKHKTEDFDVKMLAKRLLLVGGDVVGNMQTCATPSKFNHDILSMRGESLTEE